MRSIIDLIMNSYTSSLYTKNYTHYTLDILAFCLYYFLLIKKRRYFILLKQPPIWSVCLWCAFSGRFVRACVCFVWVSFSSFVCRSSWSFFVCVACCVRFRSFRVVFRIRVFVSYFEVDSRIRFLEFSKSYFEVEFQIRLFRFVALFDFSNFVALVDFSNFNFRFELRIQVPWFSSSSFSMSCSIRFLEFRFESFVALFDFSNFVAQFDFSNFEFSIRVFDSSTLNLMIRICRRISNSSWSIRLLEFRFVISIYDFDSKVSLLYSISRILICEPRSPFEFLIELFNFRRNFDSRAQLLC